MSQSRGACVHKPFRFHMDIEPSSAPDTISFFEVKMIFRTISSCASAAACIFTVHACPGRLSIAHTRISPFIPPDAKDDPSGENARDIVKSAWGASRSHRHTIRPDSKDARNGQSDEDGAGAGIRRRCRNKRTVRVLPECDAIAGPGDKDVMVYHWRHGHVLNSVIVCVLLCSIEADYTCEQQNYRVWCRIMSDG